LNNPRILVVEDEFVVSLALTERLTSMGYQVVGSAAGGPRALELVTEHLPDLVLMDIRLQGEMDGIDTAHQVRAHFHIPVIFLTAYSEDSTLERAKLAEPFGFILKPFENRELKSAIEIALYKHRSEEEIFHLNRLYDVLSQVNQSVVRLTTRQELFEAVCLIMVERGNIDLAWIGWDDPAGIDISRVARCEKNEKLFKPAEFCSVCPGKRQCNPRKAIVEGKRQICNECGIQNRCYHCEHESGKFGFHSCGAFPIHFQGKACGVLTLGVERAGYFQEREIKLLEEVVLDISFALDKMESDYQREKLHEQNRRQLVFVQTLMDAIPFPVFYKDAERRYLGCNSEFEHAFGVKREQLLGKTAFDLYPEDLAKIYDHFDRVALTNREDQVYESQVEAPGGVRRDVVFHKALFRDPGGRVGGIIGVAEDITERKHAEAQLRESEKKFFIAFHHAPVMAGITVLEDGAFLDVNNKFLEISGYTREEVIGKTSVGIGWLRPEDRLRLVEAFSRQSNIPGMEFTAFTKDKRQVHCLYHCVLATIGGRKCLLTMALDITERKRAEELLKESANKLSALFDSDPTGKILVEQTTRTISEINNAALQILGLSRDQVIGRVCHGFVCPAERGKCPICDLGQVVDRSERELLKPDGTRVPILKTVVPLALNGVDYLLESFIDISDHKRAREAQLESEERYRGLFETMALGVIYQDTEARILDANPAASRILGAPADELTGKKTTDPHWRTIHEDGSDFPAETHPCMTALRTGREVLNQVMGIYNPALRDYRWVSINAVPRFKPAETTPYQAYTIFEDITERKKAEMQRQAAREALKKSDSVIRGITDSTQDAILMMDRRGSISFWNPAAQRLFGYSAEEALGSPLHDLLAPAHYLEAFLAGFARFQETGHTEIIGKTVELLARAKNGEEFPIELSLSSIRFEDGLHAVGIVRDITERKKAEITKEKLEEQLRHTQQLEAIGVLAGGIAHDFNNILSPIIGYSELALRDIPEDDRLRRALNQILTAANRAKELVKQILSFSRKGDDQLMRPIDISSIVREALKLLRATLPSSIEIVENIRPARVLGDATQIHQVVVNLCTNAAHAMRDMGTLTVSLTEELVDGRHSELLSIPGFATGNYARISVKDTGCGIGEDTMRRLFEPYFTTKEIGKGTGLGLSVVHGIVKKHGGEVVVTSELEKGSTFDVYIPLSGQKTRQKSDEDSPIPTGKARILLVDDEPPIVEFGQLILERLGYQVTGLTSSRQALEQFRTNPGDFDLIVSDYTMPQMVGTELARECLKIRADIPVIICTGFSELLEDKETGNTGIRGVAMKPLNSRQLATMVKKALETKRT
jgi:PAS domain S-box-containing protein